MSVGLERLRQLRAQRQQQEETETGHFSPRQGETLHFFSWPCPHCQRAVTIDDVYPSLDGEEMLTLWRCDSCQVVAVTPDTIRQPPVWIKRTKQ